MKKMLWIFLVGWVLVSTGCCLDVPCLRGPDSGYHYAMPQPNVQPTSTLTVASK